MSEDTPEYLKRPECAECFVHAMGKLGAAAERELIRDLLDRNTIIDQLRAELMRLRERHSALVCKLMEQNGGNHASK